MKKMISLVFLKTFFVFILQQNILAQFCGSHGTHDETFERLVHGAEFNTNLRSSDQKIFVPVIFHYTIKNDGSIDDELYSSSQYESSHFLQRLNAAFADSKLEFYELQAAKTIPDTELYLGQNSAAVSLRLQEQYGSTRVLNVYLVKHPYSNYSGMASFPSFNLKRKMWIYLRYQYESDDYKVLEHEIGHNLHLYHTHGTSNYGYDKSALVNNTNCETTGDFVCDTPVDPNLYAKVSSSNCSYPVNSLGKDLNGNDYAPDPKNIMSYTPLSCQQHFTLGQYERAEETAVNVFRYSQYKGFTVYVKIPSQEQIPRIYYWDIEGTTLPSPTWHLESQDIMTSESEGWYSMSFPSVSKLNCLIRFPNRQSIDLKNIQQDTWVVLDENTSLQNGQQKYGVKEMLHTMPISGDSDPRSSGLKLRVKRLGTNETPQIHAWHNDFGSDIAITDTHNWPQHLPYMNGINDGWFEYTISNYHSVACLFKYNDTQTADFKYFEQDTWILLDEQGNLIKLSEQEPSTDSNRFTVYFKKPKHWNTNPQIFFWDIQPTQPSISWEQSIEMEHYDGDWYKHTFENVEQVNVIFNNVNSGNEQTSDIYAILEDTWYEWGGNFQFPSIVDAFNTGISPLAFVGSQDLKIFPNPAQKYLNIELTHLQGIDVRLYNLNGQLLYHQAFFNQRNYILDLNRIGLTKGVYLINLRTQKSLVNQKIVIQ